MKKYKQLTIIVVLLATAIFSCKKASEISDNNKSKNLGLVNTEEEKITTLSNFSKLLGINSLNRTSIKNNLVSYKLDANQTNINNNPINLNDANYIYSIDGNYINVIMKSGNKTITLLLNNNNKSIFYKEKNILLDANKQNSNINENDNADISIAMAILIELTNDKITRYDFTKEKYKLNNMIASCEKTLVSIDYSESRVGNRIGKFTSSYLSSHKDCHTIYGVDTACLWGDFGCLATQSISCNGASCN